MTNFAITHPDVLYALAAAGHKATILVADARYAASTATGPNATVVHLNLSHGAPTIQHVIALLAASVPIENVTLMRATEEHEKDQQAFRAELALDAPTHFLDRESFYAAARSQNLALCIVTGDQRKFGNVLLTVGS